MGQHTKGLFKGYKQVDKQHLFPALHAYYRLDEGGFLTEHMQPLCPLKKESRSSYSEVIMFLYIVHQQCRFASRIDSF